MNLAGVSSCREPVALMPMRRLITTTEAATACGVGSSAISMWAARGHLVRQGLDEHGRPMYRLGDVMLAARNTRRRGCGAQRVA